MKGSKNFAGAPSASRWTLWAPRFGGPTSFGESLRIERVIGVSRLLLAVLALVEIALVRLEPAAYVPMAYLTFVVFAAHSVAALLVLRYQQLITRSFVATTTALDIVLALLTLPVSGPLNPFVALFLFVLASAAFRWGRRETLLIAGGTVVVVLLRGYAGSAWPGEPPLLIGHQTLGRTIGLIGYAVVMGLLLGFLAEEARTLRVEGATLARLLSGIRLDAGVARAVTSAAKEVLALFNAARMMLVLEHRTSRRLYRWDTAGGWSVGGSMSTSPESPGRADAAFGSRAASLAIVRRRWPWRWLGPYKVRTLDSLGRLVPTRNVQVPDDVALASRFRRVAVVPVSFGDEWAGRILLFDARVNLRLVDVTRFLQTIVRQVAPALFNVHLQAQLQERAGALERARVARELHDGVIQSLVGVQMQIEVLRQNAERDHATNAGDLGRINRVLHNEVLNLRELMQQMRPIEFDPDELLDFLADLVDRFGRDTGIRATFLTDLTQVLLPWRVCFELVRIVQEGLVNVRKHSGATAVEVRFAAANDAWTLDIRDNGRGFPPADKLNASEVDVARRGPTIIKERVKAIGGQLAVTSEPGRGTRVEIRVPQGAHV